MAENKLYDVHHNAGGAAPVPNQQAHTELQDTAGQTYPEAPPCYTDTPQPNQPVYQQPVYQQPGQGYGPGYQPFVNQPMTTNTTVVMPSQPSYVLPMCKPNNYLVWSILSAIFCCPIFGIVGIIYASQVDSTYANGDYARATSNSYCARSWVIASIVTGTFVFCPIGIYFLVAMATAATAAAEIGY